MPTTIESVPPKSIAEADLKPRGRVFRSPTHWRDQILYFLLPDRFSDGAEDGRALFDRAAPGLHRVADTSSWMHAGKRFQGGTIKGIGSKLDYLRELGVTALWLGPVWKQRQDLQTYHGYGIQNFLDVDPRFGTRQELRDLVDAAHDRGIYVLLDVIYNHSGNNWFYDLDGVPKDRVSYRHHPPYPFHGWRSSAGQCIPSVAGAEDGVWPAEFARPEVYTRAGEIGRWDPASWEDPLHPENEFRRGDFFDLKDIDLNRDSTLAAIVQAYRYWIAITDCDGFRIDTVKHVSWEASRNFCGAIREYAESIGKENFLLLGEVTGGAGMARSYLDVFGRNIDAVLDIGEPAAILAGLAKGFFAPDRFFAQFVGHDLLGSHRATGRYHVSILDDHDMVARGSKARFCAGNTIPERDRQAAHAVGLQLTTLGIPCIYYGTEQAFDGSESDHDAAVEPLGRENRVPSADRYIRESMFGGTFGAFRTSGCHFFDRRHPAFLRIAAIARIRGRDDPVGLALRRGRQYLRETAVPGSAFAFPGPGELVAWSRILFDREVVVALNASGTQAKTAEVTVDAVLHPAGSKMAVLYDGAWSDAELMNPPAERFATARARNGRSIVRIDLPPAGMVILG